MIPAPPPPLPAYESYVAYERDARVEASADEYWKTLREQAPAPVTLYGRTTTQPSTRSRRVPFDLGIERSEQLSRLAQHPDARSLSTDLSQFNLLATLLFAYLFRVSGQHDLAIGAPAHNRPTLAFKNTVGLFTEVYPLRVQVDEDDSFLTLFKKVQVQANTFLRFAIPGASDRRNNAGCNTVLNYIHASFKDFCGLPVRTQWLHPGHKDRQHHLRLQVHDFADTGRFQLHFDFNANVLDTACQDIAVDQFIRLLDGMLENWDQPISQVDLLSQADRHNQIVTFNQTELPKPSVRNVVYAFEQRVVASPEAPALICGNQQVTYRELSRQVNRWACELRDRAVGRGQVVAVCMGRSPETVAAMLGVLKAGGAYVPVDPDWPHDRIAWVVEDARASVVLTQPDVKLPPPTGVQVIPVPRDMPGSEQDGQDAIDPAMDKLDDLVIDADDTAYVMYTSGSTGKPKGVVICHGALANYVSWACDAYVQRQQLAFPLFTPLTFDLTVTSIFVPLVSGGRVVIYPPSSTKADLALLDVLDDNLVDIIKLTPSHLALIQGRDLRESRVRQLILGGEDLPVDLARRTSRAFAPGVQIHNEYGPTEATVGCIVHTYDPDRDLGLSVPIGRPIARMQAYVLDRRLNPVPKGVVGDLYVGGIGLASGYNRRPKLTEDRFIANPFRPGTRLYRTGDLVRFGEQGELEYMGRRDHQVKIRGARIELGEIESVITSHPGVAACVVDVFERKTGLEPGPEVIYCTRCGLPSNYPGTQFDAEGVCQQCRAFDTYRGRAQAYFRSMRELKAIFSVSTPTGSSDYDCIALLSGGKDSTYMLCRLVDMGLKVLAFTLDNGYISDQAKANIRRVVQALRVDHMFGSTPAMNEIFADSLRRHANVCQGCFKTIYTLSMNEAKQRGIPFIVTGLSRGQFFETRLTDTLFTDPDLDVNRIDQMTLQARKSYHRVNDAVYRLLDVEMFKDDRIFDEVQFIDFYRYCDVDLDEMMSYLDRRVPWVRPSDTGRSTNCLINDVGIYVHQRQRGYHNYALPYSWDVRMGHKTRNAALAELDDRIDVQQVQQILREVGYDGDLSSPASEKRLVAYYTGADDVGEADLRRLVSRALPEFMMPTYFVRIEHIPLTSHGKVDRAALPEPGGQRPSIEAPYVAPRTDTQKQLVAVWRDVLRLDQIGIHDNFFDLGGDSIMAIQIVARARRVGLHLLPVQLVDHPTIEALSELDITAHGDSDQPRDEGDVPLTPAGHWFFEQRPPVPQHWNHVLYLSAPDNIDPSLLEQSLRYVIGYHDVFRLRYRLIDGRWQASTVPTAPPLELRVIDTSDLGDNQRQATLVATEAQMNASLDLDQPRLIDAALYLGSDPHGLLLAIHHLAIDAVSWFILLEDLHAVYQQLRSDQAPALPPRTASIGQWINALTSYADTHAIRDQYRYWCEALDQPTGAIPSDSDIDHPDSRPDATAGDRVSVALDREETRRLLDQMPHAGRASVPEVLITALSVTLSNWTDHHTVRLFLESHGRQPIPEEIDVSRTAGWFTNIYPVTLRRPSTGSLSQILLSVKEQLRAIPEHGLGYGLLRYLCRDATIRQQLTRLESPQERVLFNYLGGADQMVPPGGLFGLLRPLTLSRDQALASGYVLEIDAMVVDERLTVKWSFDRHRLKRSTVQRHAEAFAATLRAIVDACVGGDRSGVSVSDFPLADLNQSELEKLSSLLSKKDQPR